VSHKRKQGIARFVSCTFCKIAGTMVFKEVRKMNQIKIGQFLKELRKETGLTQEQFAEQFNLSRRTVSRWENGNNMPDLDMLLALADFYGATIALVISNITLTVIFFGTGSYYNHGITGVYYALLALVGVFGMTGVVMTVISKKEQQAMK